MTCDFVSRVVSNDRIAQGTHNIVMEPEDAPGDFSPAPGQFAHIAPDGVFLRRPISLSGFDEKNRRVRFIVRRTGRGTEALALMKPGETAKTLMPLGNPFPIERAAGPVWLAGGGMGTAPLIYAARSLAESGRATEIKSFIGFRSDDDAFGLDELAAFGRVSADMGGLVTDLVRRALETGRPGVLFSCGPAPMLAALQKICAEHNIEAYASLEARMGCGVGACLVCNCLAASGARYRRVCKDGPVFGMSEVTLT